MKPVVVVVQFLTPRTTDCFANYTYTLTEKSDIERVVNLIKKELEVNASS